MIADAAKNLKMEIVNGCANINASLVAVDAEAQRIAKRNPAKIILTREGNSTN
jgi:hypothetical protein